MSGMDNRKLEVFLSVADCGNLTRVAERFSYTQSGVTQMMNALEQELGFKLLIRSNKGVRLTKEAALILPNIREIRNAQERLFQECSLIRGVEEGSISIGSFSSISVHWLPAIIQSFGERYPNIEVEIFEGTPEELANALADGRVDLCFLSIHPDSPFENTPLLKDPLLAVLPSGHPLCGLKTVPPARLAEYPFIAYRAYDGVDEDIAPVLAGVGGAWNTRCASNFDQSIASMVERGLGVSILSELILRGCMQKVEVRPLEPPVYRDLGISVRSLRDVSPAMRRFIQCSKETVLQTHR